jgi:tRNA-2-methylthio-N6-dimethylallyladenosine synthase
MKNNYYVIETMGCQMNERDSETIAGMLEELGYSRAPGEGAEARMNADVIVMNTCSVRENADNKFFGALGTLKSVKEADPEKVIAVCGCMTQQPHIVKRIRERFGWVDVLFGAMNIEAFPSLLAEALERRGAGQHMVVDVRDERGDVVEGLPFRRARGYKAFVNIMFGCDNFCTYCVVPYTRGRERSREPDAVISEIRALAEDGVKEVVLLGQNVNSYQGGGVDFPALLHLVDEVPGIERVRFMTSHPKDLSDGLIDCYRTVRSLCPSIHLPVQSGSTEVLRRMNRGYSREMYMSLIDRLREARPGIAISTDFIVGFPGETDEDFEDTMDLIERVRFDAAFTFLYSPRVGTPAASYADRVPDHAAHARFDRMVKRLNDISLEKNELMVGQVAEVLIVGPCKTYEDLLAGRTPVGRLVIVRGGGGAGGCGDAKKAAGVVAPVRLIKAGTFSFLGEFVSVAFMSRRPGLRASRRKLLSLCLPASATGLSSLPVPAS